MTTSTASRASATSWSGACRSATAIRASKPNMRSIGASTSMNASDVSRLMDPVKIRSDKSLLQDYEASEHISTSGIGDSKREVDCHGGPGGPAATQHLGPSGPSVHLAHEHPESVGLPQEGRAHTPHCLGREGAPSGLP